MKVVRRPISCHYDADRIPIAGQAVTAAAGRVIDQFVNIDPVCPLRNNVQGTGELLAAEVGGRTAEIAQVEVFGGDFVVTGIGSLQKPVDAAFRCAAIEFVLYDFARRCPGGLLSAGLFTHACQGEREYRESNEIPGGNQFGNHLRRLAPVERFIVDYALSAARVDSE